MKPIRLMMVITRLELGGAQQVVINILRQLPRRKYQLYLVAGRGGLLDEEARSLKQVAVHLWPGFKHSVRPLQDIVTLLRLVWLMRSEKINIVHTHSSKAGMLGRIAAWLAGVPIVIHTVHGWPFHDYQFRLWRGVYIFIERMAARLATRLIAVSEATRRQGLKNRIGSEQQYTVILPGSNLRDFTPAGKAVKRSVRGSFGFAADALLVGMIACLKPQKAPENFVRAAAYVIQREPRARFLLVGDGLRRKYVEQEISRWELQNRLVLTGWRRDVPGLMGALDLLVLSSLWEGLPCVFAQAQACGLPIVATDVAGAREAIEPGKTGMLVPPQNSRALGRAILSILKSQAIRRSMGKAAFNSTRKFGLDIMLGRHDELYRECLK